jgi:hypothetical protein
MRLEHPSKLRENDAVGARTSRPDEIGVLTQTKGETLVVEVGAGVGITASISDKGAGHWAS